MENYPSLTSSRVVSPLPQKGSASNTLKNNVLRALNIFINVQIKIIHVECVQCIRIKLW